MGLFLEDGEDGFIVHCLPTGFRFYSSGKKLELGAFKKEVHGLIHECNSLLKMVDVVKWKSESAEPLFGKYHKDRGEV